MDLPYVDVSCMMRTLLGVDIELRDVSSCEVSQGVNWVN